jgi:hypothetical protein
MKRSGVKCIRRVRQIFRGRCADYRGNGRGRLGLVRARSIALVLQVTDDFIDEASSVWKWSATVLEQ